MALVLTRLVRSNYDELDNIPIIHQDLTASFTKQAGTYYIHTGSTTSAYTKGRMYYCDGTNLKKVVIVDELPAAPNNGKLTITVNGTAHTFTANQAGDTSFSITNTDTGMTSVEVTGNGNAVTAASYNASTRKLTLTKGATFLTSHQDISGKLDKTTYEWNKEFLASSNGAISLGRYNIYDTQLTFDISSTTTASMSGKLVIATQNGRILQAKIFGDATGALVSKIVIYQSAIINNKSWVEVFCNFDGWSKNKVHIYGVALNSATVTNQMSSVTFTNGVPSPVTSGDSKWSDTIVNDLSGKQDKLTAGSNITISGSKISAKDTTYTFTASDPTLAWGMKSKIGTIGGVEFNVTMPANPNTDTGATSVTVDGSGNAVTKASYDASSRKLTLTKETTFLTGHQNIKKLNTNNTATQTTNASETITGSGTINLHKVAKTGSYNDLLNKPTIPTKTSQLTNDSSFVKSTAGAFTGNLTATNFNSRFSLPSVPYGTAVGENADLNTVTYLSVGNYYCGADAIVSTMTNVPVKRAFMMTVYSPLTPNVDNETTGKWVYRVRKFMTYLGEEYIQSVYSGNTAGTFTYGAWQQIAHTSDIPIKSATLSNSVLTLTL